MHGRWKERNGRGSATLVRQRQNACVHCTHVVLIKSLREGVNATHLPKQHMGDRSAAHRSTRMPRLGLLHNICTNNADGINAATGYDIIMSVRNAVSICRLGSLGRSLRGRGRGVVGVVITVCRALDRGAHLGSGSGWMESIEAAAVHYMWV
jgi:hypothetical protein